LREAASFHAQTPQNNHRVVKILNKLFWVVEYKRGGQRQQVKKLLGSIVCFENQALVSGDTPYEQISIPDKFYFFLSQRKITDTKQINLYKAVQKLVLFLHFGFSNLCLCSIASNQNHCFY